MFCQENHPTYSFDLTEGALEVLKCSGEKKKVIFEPHIIGSRGYGLQIHSTPPPMAFDKHRMTNQELAKMTGTPYVVKVRDRRPGRKSSTDLKALKGQNYGGRVA